MSAPAPLPDRASGADCVAGVAVVLHPLVTRVTAPNPSIMTGPGTNTYVVGDDDTVVVIDPGPSIDAHLALVSDVIASRHVAAVAVTHHHVDHAPGARELASAHGAPVTAFGHASLSVDVVATEGTVLDAGAVRLVAWHTPGHASDHLCFHVPSLAWLFTGDHLMQGSTVVIRPPDGDLTRYLVGVARVRDEPGLEVLAPGHGRLVSEPRLAAIEVLEHRRARAALVEEALRAHGPASASELRRFAYVDVGAERDELAVATCWAHLLALVDEARATSAAARDDPTAVFAAVT